MFKNKIIIWILLFTSFVCKGQRYNFKTYNVNEGLSQAQVMAMCQDNEGYLWFGTLAGGISKFDGINFQNFTIKDGLSSNSVRYLFKDKKGNIWVGTWDGLNKYIPPHLASNIKGKFQHINSDTLFAVSGIESICEDNEGNFWLASHRAGILIYNPENETLKNLTVKDGLASDHLHSIARDQKGIYWIGTGKGLQKYDGINFTLFTTENGLPNNHIYLMFIDTHENLWITTSSGGVDRFDGSTFKHFALSVPGQKNNISCLQEDSKGNMYFGTEYGVCKIQYDELNSASELIPNITANEGLTNSKINKIIEDTEGNIWFATDGGGVIRYQGKRFMNFTTKDGLSHNNVISILIDKKQNIWLGTLGGGLNIFDGKSFKKYDITNGLANNDIWSLLQTNDGKIWVGSPSGINVFENNTIKKFSFPEKLSKISIAGMLVDSKGNIWVCSNGNGVSIISNANDNKIIQISVEEGLAHEDTRCVKEDKDGAVWIGSKAGLSKIYFEKNSENEFKIFNYVLDEKLKDQSVMDIEQDYQGNFWVGSNEGGIYYFKNSDNNVIDKEHIININENSGLSSDLVYFVQFDNNENLWVGTVKGIDKIDISKFYQLGKTYIKHYGVEEGIVGLETNHNAAFKDAEGNLWFGTTGGVIKYNHEEDKFNTLEPYIKINKHRLFLIDTILQNGVTLAYNQNHISFEFTGICHSNAINVHYQYMLDGFDKGWSPVTKQNIAIYSNLPHGNFTFKVRASNNDGVWNKNPATFDFVILPPFWKTWWFYCLTLIMTFSSLWGLFRLRVKKIQSENQRKSEMINAMVQAQETERKRIAVDLHDGVGNLLSSIKLNISSLESEKEKLKDEKKKVYDNALILIDEACSDLRTISHNMMPGSLVELGLVHALEEHFDKVSKTGNMKINAQISGFNKRLPETIEVVLYRVIQELFNNIIKHAKANVVNVKMINKSNEVKIEIIDNGVGFEISKLSLIKNGIGLGNIESRVAYLSGTVEFESHKEQGTRVLIKIPV